MGPVKPNNVLTTKQHYIQKLDAADRKEFDEIFAKDPSTAGRYALNRAETSHNGVRIGDTVKITETFRDAKKAFDGQNGTVRQIYQLINGMKLYLIVELCVEMRDTIKSVNALPKVKDASKLEHIFKDLDKTLLVVCDHIHLEVVYPMGAGGSHAPINGGINVPIDEFMDVDDSVEMMDIDGSPHAHIDMASLISGDHNHAHIDMAALISGDCNQAPIDMAAWLRA